MTQHTQHTQGPWEVKKTPIGEWDSGHRIMGGTGEIVAQLPIRVNVDACRAMEANACLIAAAPELLEALILAEAQIESFYTATMTNAKSRDENKAIKKMALENVRKAIAKARGE